MGLCIKCNRREAIPGGNLCEEDSIIGSSTAYAHSGNYSGQSGSQVGQSQHGQSQSQGHDDGPGRQRTGS